MRRFIYLASTFLVLSASAQAADPAPVAPVAPVAPAAPLARADVENIIKEYLTAHPDVIVDALKNFEEQQNAQQREQMKKGIIEQREALLNDPSSPTAGAKDADVTVVEFFDYHCGYCKHQLPVIAEELKSDPKLKVIFKELPILSEDSKVASQAALAAYKISPDKYFAFHSALMQTEGKFNDATIAQAAKKAGVNEAKLKEAMKAPEIEATLQKNQELAAKLGVRGTPVVIIGDEVMMGFTPPEAFKMFVQQARNKGKAPAAVAPTAAAPSPKP